MSGRSDFEILTPGSKDYLKPIIRNNHFTNFVYDAIFDRVIYSEKGCLFVDDNAPRFIWLKS